MCNRCMTYTATCPVDTVGFKLEPCFGVPGEDEWAEGTEGRHKLQCCYTCLFASRVLAECYGALAGHFGILFGSKKLVPGI